MEITRKLYKISAGLIIGYFLICCFFNAVPKLPVAIVSLLSPMSLPDKLPTGMMLLSIATYSPCLLFAAMALISLKSSIENAKARLCISGGFLLASVILVRLLSIAASSAISRAENAALMSVISVVTNFFSLIYTAGMIILFCALSIETYEYTRQTRIQGS